MPGYAKWTICRDENASCWICDKWSYAIVFWSRTIGSTYKEHTDLSKSEESQKKNLESLMKNYRGEAPLITCSANGWQIPVPMLGVHTFTDAIDY